MVEVMLIDSTEIAIVVIEADYNCDFVSDVMVLGESGDNTVVGTFRDFKSTVSAFPGIKRVANEGADGMTGSLRTVTNEVEVFHHGLCYSVQLTA